MGFFTTRIVAIIAAVLLAGAGGWGGWQYVQLQRANTKAAEAEVLASKYKTEYDHLNAEVDKAIAAMKDTQVTIQQLQQEKLDIQSAVKALDADKKKNLTIINNLSAAIKAAAKEPANQVALSPVLQMTVDTIQKQRAAREGGQK